jgi:PAS domain S-box-containing protein
MASASGLRVLQVRILPVPGGVTLLWHDVTERARSEQALKRSEERLALAAEGANDGLWEWDLRTQEFYFSGRWREMLGLPPNAGIGRPNEWIERVHSEDAPGLKAALEGPFNGTADHFQHEHRIRHEDGTYRRFLCRGVAVRGAGRRSIRIAGSLTDTTEQAIAQERLRNAGFLDPLTGLCNRAVFVEGLGRRLTEFKERRGGSRFAVLVSRPRSVQGGQRQPRTPGGRRTAVGGGAPSRVVSASGRRARQARRRRIRDSAERARRRSAGQCRRLPHPEIVELAVLDWRARGFHLGKHRDSRSARAQYNNPEEIMRDADVAMYHAKSGGKARHEVFDADMHARALDRLGLESDLRHAVNQNDFEVHYQPIVLLDSGMCVGFESLSQVDAQRPADLAGDVHSDRRRSSG